MDEVGKAHGTWVGTLLEVDGRAPCTDGDADADADADGDADGQTSSWVSRNQIQACSACCSESEMRCLEYAAGVRGDLEMTLESPLDCKEIQPVHSEGDQP